MADASIWRHAASTVIVRTPLLSFDEYHDWSAGLSAPRAAADPTSLEEALAADRSLLRSRLAAILERPSVREAIYIASRDIEFGLEQWRSRPESQAGRRAEQALVRYFSRMSGRATPFGFFAGWALGRVGEKTDLSLAAADAARRLTRIDAGILAALAERLGRDHEARERLPFYPNTSIYSLAGQVRYIEAALSGGRLKYHLTAVDDSPYLRAVIERAAGGATLPVLADALTTLDEEIPHEEARAFLEEMVDSQLLVPALLPTTSDVEPLSALVETARRAEVGGDAVEALVEAAETLAALDAGGLGAPPARYEQIAETLRRLALPKLSSHPFQSELVKSAPDFTLGPPVLREVRAAVELLHAVVGGPGRDRLEPFRRAFLERYEMAEVPLVEALDEENGIGFPRAGPAGEGSGAAARTQRLASLFARALRTGSREVELEPDDVEALGGGTPAPLPDAFSVMSTVLGASSAAVEDGDFRLLVDGVLGPSGLHIVGRGCLADPALARFAREHLDAEEALQPDAVFAEIVHLPEGALGKVIFRPVLRKHEIPYLGVSSAPREQQIAVSDLLVSVQNGRVVLRSRRLGCRVLPRLSSAHNFFRSDLPVYRFLAILQAQDVATELSWSWGALNTQPFLPRVRRGRIILSRATWNLPGAVVERLRSLEGAARYAAVQELRREWSLPRCVAWANHDNLLPVDLENVLSIDAFASAARGDIRLVETFVGDEDVAVRGPEGRYVHELVIPFLREEGAARPSRGSGAHRRPPSVAGAPSRPRTFAPGSEWLYAKLYTGEATADRVLTGLVAPLLEEVRRSGAVDRWFFIRYADPGFHLRVRFHGDPARLWGELVPLLNERVAPWLADGSVWKVQLDTYVREMERYGGDAGIEMAEAWFEADSDAALALLASDELHEDPGTRLLFTLAGTDMLLADLGLTVAGRREVLLPHQAAMGAESGTRNLRAALADEYRSRRSAIEAALRRVRDGDPGGALAPLRARSLAASPIFGALRQRERDGVLPTSPEVLARSFVHMHANRMLRSDARRQETVITHFLIRSYESALARQRTPGDRSAAARTVGAGA